MSKSDVNGLVLVTGATGKTGRALSRLLEDAGVPFRAASRSSAPSFDWSRPETWDAALEDAGPIYLVAPSGLDDAPERMIAFLKAAMRRGAGRFVLLSMASLPAGGPAQGRVHQWLIDRADDWAVLCPSAFMQNFSEGPYLASIRDEDTIYSNTGSGHAPFIDVGDIARAALAALTATAPLNGAFTLTGGEAISYDGVADRISQACGRRITHTRITTAQMADRLRARGIPDRAAAFLAVGYQTIADGAQETLSGDFQTLTGRTPIGFEAFAQANADVWNRTTPR